MSEYTNTNTRLYINLAESQKNRFNEKIYAVVNLSCKEFDGIQKRVYNTRRCKLASKDLQLRGVSNKKDKNVSFYGKTKFCKMFCESKRVTS